MSDARGVRVRQGPGGTGADLRRALPGQRAVVADLGGQGLAIQELHDDPGRAVLLDHVVDGDHAVVAQPGGCPGLAHRAGGELGLLGWRQLRREQDFLDCHGAVQELVTPAPYPALAALPDQATQQVPAAHDLARFTRHEPMIRRARG
jgi:hypothetical protein